jgi:hypothetical protein
MEFLFALVTWVISGWICEKMAKSFGRDDSLWFIIGLIFGWPAIAVLFFMGEADKPKNKP